MRVNLRQQTDKVVVDEEEEEEYEVKKSMMMVMPQWQGKNKSTAMNTNPAYNGITIILALCVA
jgi:hypothetical protein